MSRDGIELGRHFVEHGHVLQADWVSMEVVTRVVVVVVAVVVASQTELRLLMRWIPVIGCFLVGCSHWLQTKRSIRGRHFEVPDGGGI